MERKKYESKSQMSNIEIKREDLVLESLLKQCNLIL